MLVKTELVNKIKDYFDLKMVYWIGPFTKYTVAKTNYDRIT